MSARYSASIPRPRVRVPMPVNTPMLKPTEGPDGGTVADPWLYYLMKSPVDRFLKTGWIVGPCDPLETANDVSIWLPITMPGTIAMVGFVAKDPPDEAGMDAVLDIKKSADGGTTWASIFETGDPNKIVLAKTNSYPGVQWGTFDAAQAVVSTGEVLRIDVLTPGTNTQYVTVEVYILLDEFDAESLISPVGPGPTFYNFPEAVL